MAGGGGASVNELNPSQVNKLNKILRNAKFKVTHRYVSAGLSRMLELTSRQTDRVFSLKGFTHQPAENIKFLLTGKDGAADKMVTIVEYYKKTYNATVTKPRLPCVQYGNKNFVP